MWLVRLRLLLKSVGREGLILLLALRHPATPRKVKLWIVALLLYIISPIDLIPDVLPVIGVVDDAAVFLVAVPWLVRQLPAQVRAECAETVRRVLSRFSFRGT